MIFKPEPEDIVASPEATLIPDTGELLPTASEKGVIEPITTAVAQASFGFEKLTLKLPLVKFAAKVFILLDAFN